MGNTTSTEVIVPPDNIADASICSVENIYEKVSEPTAIFVFVCLAPYCAISRSLNAELPQLAADFPTVNFYKVNTEKNQIIPQKLNVEILPHVSIMVRSKGADITEQAHFTGNQIEEIRKVLTDLTKPPEEEKKTPLEKIKDFSNQIKEREKEKKQKALEEQREKEKEKEKEKQKGKKKGRKKKKKDGNENGNENEKKEENKAE